MIKIIKVFFVLKIFLASLTTKTNISTRNINSIVCFKLIFSKVIFSIVPFIEVLRIDLFINRLLFALGFSDFREPFS